MKCPKKRPKGSIIYWRNFIYSNCNAWILLTNSIWLEQVLINSTNLLSSSLANHLFTVPPYSKPSGLRIHHCSNTGRLQHLHHRCKVWKDRPPPRFTHATNPKEPLYYWSLLTDDRNKALYCVVPKAACTTWKTIMANMTVVDAEWKRAFKQESRFNVHNEVHMKTIGFKFLNQYKMD